MSKRHLSLLMCAQPYHGGRRLRNCVVCGDGRVTDGERAEAAIDQPAIAIQPHIIREFDSSDKSK